MRIAVAMSGGADSTAAALLLKQEGHDVVGLHLRLHDNGHSAWESAKEAAHEIRVPIQRVELVNVFREFVIEPFIREYAEGRTPSPCPGCNRSVKFEFLFAQARNLGCEKIATGHYARIVEDSGQPALLRAADVHKDQSYFLFMVRPEILRRTVFPLGAFTKGRVREILRERKISIWESEESQELCFIPDGNYREFLARQGLRSRPGAILDSQGRKLGEHKGIIGYTVGQRHGLGVCGPERLYVIRIDAADNAVILGTRRETRVSSVRIGSISMLRSAVLRPGERLEVKVRSTSRQVGCIVERCSADVLELNLDEPQCGVAPGQAAVLYSGDRVDGGGWILPGDPVR